MRTLKKIIKQAPIYLHGWAEDGKLYEVNAGHCSCYGLENQWTPEETNIEALKHRLINGSMGRDNYSGNEYANELINFLGIN